MVGVMKRENIMRAWLSIWLYVIAAIGGGIIMYLVLCYENLELYVILSALTTLVLILHVLEEWHIPGGFHYMYNKVMRDSKYPERYPMSQVTDMLTNFIPIIYCLVMLMIGMPYWAALTGAWLSIAEVFIHIGAGNQTRKALKEKESQFPYDWGSGYFQKFE